MLERAERPSFVRLQVARPVRLAPAAGGADWQADIRARPISTEVSTWLDALRVFLLAQVVFGHLVDMALPPVSDLAGHSAIFTALVWAIRLTTRFGHQAAALFVMLSGFLVGGPLLASGLRGERVAAGDFARRRLIRIVPTLWIVLCLTACFDLAGVFGLGAIDVYTRQGAVDFGAVLTVGTFIGNLFCLQPTLVDPFGSNGPLWTLGYIVQFYAVGWLACRAIARPARWAVLALAGAMLAMVGLCPEWAAFFAVFCLGATMRVFDYAERFGAWGLAAGAALFVGANLAPLTVSPLICGLAGVLIFGWINGTPLRIAAALRAAIRPIAALSYEAYAVHFPAAFFLFAIALGRPTANLGVFAGFVLAALAGVALLSAGVQRLAATLATPSSARAHG